MQLSHGASRISHSFVRNILALTQKPGVISFAGGLPDPYLFPITPIKEAMATLMQELDVSLFQYGPTQGFLPLREALALQYQHKDIPASAKDILITTGSQQGLDLTCRALMNPKDAIVVESPTYLAALQLFRSHEATIHTVSITPEGPDIKALEALFQMGTIRFFYTIPTFQNPTGFTCSAPLRRKVAALAKQYGVWIVEDDPYGALRYEGTTPPSYATLFPEGTMVLGTASKVVAPDFRLGWLYAPQEALEACIKFKECTDLQSSYFFQRVLHEMMTNDTLRTHQKRLKRAYVQKRDTMVSALKEHFGEALHVEVPEGGMFVWASLKDGRDTMELFHEAIKHHVAFVPGSVFFPCGGGQDTMRLNFTHSTTEKIVEGVARLKKAYTLF
ncbi:MAG: PLP-dependent aminotransferase family protein [Campylobacterales bacterium]|nr:PLP-dependent aminotransferase family protein [Campylobacterales bacterium]